MKILLGLFLIAHGLIHASYLTPKPNDPRYPFYFDRGWLGQVAGFMAKPLGMALVVLTVVMLALAGLAVMGLPGLAGLWKPLVIAGAAASLAVLLLFWHPWLVMGILIDIVLLIGILKLGWSFR